MVLRLRDRGFSVRDAWELPVPVAAAELARRPEGEDRRMSRVDLVRSERRLAARGF